MQYVHHLRDWVFSRVHQSQLIYNTCWEDPRCDRQLLQFDTDSRVVMITSAGCNALDYLLDHPQHIHCVDMNPRQNALLALKLALFEQGTYEQLWQVFGLGTYAQIDTLYQRSLRAALPAYAQQYWDEHLHFFRPDGLRRSFYYYGTSGLFAWLLTQYLRSRPRLYSQVEQLFHAEDLEQQRALYYAVEEKLLSQLVSWALRQHLTLCLLGVPRSQQLLFKNNYRDGVAGFARHCLRNVFTRLPIRDNYFYQLYFHGNYTADCAPSYLLPQHFETIQSRSSCISTHTTTISAFLQENPGSYSHFILLDHQDWLAANDLPALEEEWRLILANSRPGTRILLRSAAEQIDFFPDFVTAVVRFEKDEWAEVHQQDRVGTYLSTYVGIVQ